MDFFAGSGTVGESCLALGRRFLLTDSSAEAYAVMRKRLGQDERVAWMGDQLPDSSASVEKVSG